MSSLRSADDFSIVREYISKQKLPHPLPLIIAKVETRGAVDHFAAILNKADGIMVVITKIQLYI